MPVSARETCEKKTATRTNFLTNFALGLLVYLTECYWKCCSCGLKPLAVSGLVIMRGVSLPVSQNKVNKEKKSVLWKLEFIVLKGFKKHLCFPVFCLHRCCNVLIAVETPQQTSHKI